MALLRYLLVYLFFIFFLNTPALCRQHEESGPNLTNLTKTEIELAYTYWNYNATLRIKRQGTEADKHFLGYDFFIPLPERLSGLSYVGHAARLRLLLERIRSGEAIRISSVGGSITAGQGIGGGRHSYARQFTNWLNAALPPTYMGKGQTRYPVVAAPESEEVPQGGFEADGEAGAEEEQEDRKLRRRALLGGWDRDWDRDRERDREKGFRSGGRRERGRQEEDDSEGRSQLDPGRQLAALREATEEASSGGDAALPGSGGAGSSDGDEGRGSNRQETSDGRLQARRALRSSSGPATLQHEYISGAMSGTMSSYMSSCLSHHVPPGVDLVFVEYACNDPPVSSWAFTDPIRRAFERMIRKLLRLPSQPALIIVNMYSHQAAHGKFYHNAERDFNELAVYYRIPTVSLKAAVVPPTKAGDEGDGKTKSSVPELSLAAIFNGGHHHPGRGGHVMVVEELITLALDLLESNARLQGPSSRQSWGWKDGAVGEEEGIESAAFKALTAIATRPLPPPVAEGNYEAARSMCYVESELQGLVKSAEGWHWTDENRRKWGWVAEKSGAVMRLQLNTRLEGARSVEASSAPIIVQFAYLQSYSNMGTVKITCESGCECEPVTIDSYDPRPVSVTAMFDHPVSQNRKCVLQLKTAGRGKTVKKDTKHKLVLPANDAMRGEKFKLLGVVVGEEPGAERGSVTWLRGETHSKANQYHNEDR